MRKIIILLILTIILYTFILYILNSLEPCRNLIISESTGYLFSNNMNQLRLFTDNNKNILDSSVYQRFPNKVVKTNGRKVSKISVYHVDEFAPGFFSIKMLNGRFIWNRDAIRNLNYIVLDKKTAIDLFSTVKCNGLSVKLDNKNYEVLGVYKAKSSLLSELSSVDYRTCFVPLTLPKRISNTFNIMFKVKERTSSIVTNNIEKFLKNTFMKDTVVENIDMKIRLTEQKIILLNFFILILLLIGIYKTIKPFIQKMYERINNELKLFYPIDLIKIHKYKLLFTLIIIFFIIILTLFIIERVNIYFAVEPSIIPSKLINLNEFYNKLKTSFIEKNTQLVIFNTLSASTKYADVYVNYTIIIFIFLTVSLFGSSIKKFTNKN